MPQGYYRQVSKILRQYGYERTKAGKIVVVSYNMKSRHTANGTLKQAGISENIQNM